MPWFTNISPTQVKKTHISLTQWGANIFTPKGWGPWPDLTSPGLTCPDLTCNDLSCPDWLNTWVNLPYLEVGKSGLRTPDLGSLYHTFICGLKLPTLAVSWPHSQTANLGSLMAGFQPFTQSMMRGNVLKLPNLAVSWPIFRTVISNCTPCQFHGQFSSHWELWFSNCRPWQFHGQLL